MESVTIFFKDHWKVIMIGLFGVALGVISNQMVQRHNNKNLLASLTDDFENLKAKENPTKDDQNLIEYLQGEIYILKFRCR